MHWHHPVETRSLPLELVGSRTSVRVLHRASVLFALAERAISEHEHGTGRADGILSWLEATGAVHEAEADEVKCLRAATGELGQRRLADISWHSEGAGVLLWALGAVDLPSIDRTVIVSSADFDRVREGKVSPRSLETITRFEELMYKLQWRLRDFLWRATPHDAESSCADVGTLAGVDLPSFANRDLIVSGKPISVAHEDEVMRCATIVRERRWAATWLVDEDDQSEISLDT